jgi:hypothetical protein
MLVLAGCTNQIADEGTGDVIMRVVSMNGGDTAFASDVQNLDSGTTADKIDAQIAVRSKHPLNNETNYSRAVILERYEVRYYRSDGRNTQGVDVPYNISGDLTIAIDVGDTDKNVELPIEIVRLQAKIEPPLFNLRRIDGVFAGQQQVLTVFAEVTFYGRQIFNGSVVTAKGTLQIDFADYADQSSEPASEGRNP